MVRKLLLGSGFDCDTVPGREGCKAIAMRMIGGEYHDYQFLCNECADRYREIIRSEEDEVKYDELEFHGMIPIEIQGLGDCGEFCKIIIGENDTSKESDVEDDIVVAKLMKEKLRNVGIAPLPGVSEGMHHSMSGEILNDGEWKEFCLPITDMALEYYLSNVVDDELDKLAEEILRVKGLCALFDTSGKFQDMIRDVGLE